MKPGNVLSIFGSIAIVSALLLASVPATASAQTGGSLEWEVLDAFGAGGNMIVNPSEVNDVVVGAGGAMYAVDTANSKFYRSLNSGATWDDLTSQLDAPGLPITAIAASTQRSGLLVVVTNAGTKAFISRDGGINWADMYAPPVAGTIRAVAISPEYVQDGKTLVDIAIGTALWGDGATTGQVWVMRYGDVFATWDDQRLTVDPAVIGGEVSAIAWSPGYRNDRTVLVIASTNADVAPAFRSKTWLSLGTRNTVTNSTTWNALPGYPVQVGTLGSPSAGDAPGVTRILSNVALPSNYSAGAAATRRALVSYDRFPDANDDVYRLNDVAVTRLNADGGAPIDIASLAYRGNALTGTLIAGDAAPVPATIFTGVRRTANPFTGLPAWTMASQPPTGPGNARVRLGSGDTVFCGTGQLVAGALDESGFSVSSDGGDTWQQISLIDTRIIFTDIALAASPRTVFIVTTSNAGIESIWRNAGEPLGRYWSRIYTFDAASNKVIMRLSPSYDSDYTVYMAEVGGTKMAVSHTRGNSWIRRAAPAAVVDMAIKSRDEVYLALAGGAVAFSNDGAWDWLYRTAGGFPTINTMSLASDGTLLIGGAAGNAAYSTDAGRTFTDLPALPGGPVQVIPSVDFSRDRTVYAGAGNAIHRVTLPAPGSWETIRTAAAGNNITGLATAGGIVYVSWYNALTGDSGAERSLSPSARNPEWDTMDLGSRARRFNMTPQPLRVLTLPDEIRLWTIDTAGQKVCIYRDTLATVKPSLSTPAMVAANTTTGGNMPFSIQWQGTNDSFEYEVQVYANAGLSDLLLTAPVVPPAIGYQPPDPTHPSWLIASGLLSNGQEYYARIRIRNETQGQRIRSLWSEPVRFSVAAGALVRASQPGPTLLSPLPGATVTTARPGFSWAGPAGVASYEVQLSEDARMPLTAASMPVTVNGTAWQPEFDLKAGTTYYWRVRPLMPVPGDWSAVIGFTTQPAPTPVRLPPPVRQEQIVVAVPGAPEAGIPAALVWGGAGVMVLLAGAGVFYAVKARHSRF